MTRHTVLIVDDEEPARKKITRQLQNNSLVAVIGEAVDGPQALEQIEKHKPDIVLLDIQMPGMTGFDVVRLMEQPRPRIIFITAFDEYAIQAFDVTATDYLLKPASNERLNTAIEKACSADRKSSPQDSSVLLDNLKQPEYATRIAVRFLKRVKLVQVSDINYITSEHRVVYITDRSGDKQWTNETLDQLMKRLDPAQFFRIHRSSIINLSAEFEIEPWEDGRLKVHFPDGHALTVARDPASQLKKLLGF